jgi:ketosteroid isomerase-like protein
MADATNASVVRSLYDAYAAMDVATIDGLLVEDYVMHVSGGHPLSHSGKPAVWAYLGKVAEVVAGNGGFDVHSVTTDEEGHAVALLTGTIRDYVRPVIHVFHLRDGKITEFWDAYPNAEREDAFWREALA